MQQLPYFMPIKDRLRHYQARLSGFWTSLNLAQRCYLLAIIVSFVYLWDDAQSHGLMVGITALVLVAMLSEFWPKFIQIWDSLPGKAVILLFYGFVANYALVQASGLVNDITGVSADHLPYTHNFAVLLSVPIWFVITSLVVLLLIQFSIPVYILLLMLLRPFGLHTIWHPPGYRFGIITGFIRFGAGLFLLIQLTLLTTYTGVLYGVSQTVTNIVGDIETDLTINVIKSSDEEIAAAIKEKPELESTLSELDEAKAIIDQQASSYEKKVKRILANFIFDNEADARSRCEHSEHSRVIELNDYEILEIEKITTADKTSYRYQVKPCISAAIGHQFKMATIKP
ncbi:hypothetical protein [Pseudoalteromonas sp. MMG022]|uniref:hypothetical protein n=1 Tax=Pseudoalteromonas sp. MMG022 TaxID=2909978 RepID=UPI001F48F02B|nr:hypothetical protein [Pseudoalteromonas sp. MMG022]MCF6434823.1 hypothetical protein [Pseudoalteromonas sp. MMG022]